MRSDFSGFYYIVACASEDEMNAAADKFVRYLPHAILPTTTDADRSIASILLQRLGFGTNQSAARP